MLPLNKCYNNSCVFRRGSEIRVIRNSKRGAPQALAIIGDRYHNSDYIRTALSRTLVRDMGLSIDFTDDVSRLSANILTEYSLLIIFRDGMIWPDGYGGRGAYPGYSPDTRQTMISDPPIIHHDVTPKMWMTPTQGQAVKAFVESGNAALFFHNSSHISLSNNDFRDVEGAIYTGHPPTRPFKVHIINSNHPITKGIHDFIVTDEQHYVQYEKDPEHVLLMSENLEGLSYSGTIGNQGSSCEAGWAYDYGQGRICFFAPGHTIPALWNPEYVKLQHNAVSWLLHRE